MKFTSPTRLILAALLSTLVIGRAQTVWTGASDGVHWMDADNWDTLTLPGPTDNVTIGNDSTVVLNGSGSIYGLFVGSSALSQLTITGGSSALSSTSISFIGGNESEFGKVIIEDGADWTTYADLFVGDYGVGTLALSGGATFNGTNLYAGWNEFASGTITIDGAALLVTGDIGIGNFGTGSLTLSNGGTLSATSIVVGYGNGGSGTLTLAQNDTWGGHLGGDNPTITINAGGLMTNGGDYFNTLTNLTLNGGELRAEGGNSPEFPAWQLKGTITVGGSAASSITTTAVNSEQMQDTAIQLGNNTEGGATTFYVSNVTENAAADLTIGNLLVDGRDNVTVSVASGLIKTGGGTLVLLAGNSYSGGTIINGGTLVAGAGFQGALGSGSVTVNGDGRLAGSDSIAGLVTVNNSGYVTPGDPSSLSGGVLRFDGGLTLNDGAAMDFSLSEVSFMQLQMGTGSLLTVDGLVTVNFYDFGDFAAGNYTLLDFGNDGVTTSGFDLSNFTVGHEIEGYTFALSLTGTTLDVLATSTAIPEPSTYAAILGVGALGLAILRRRRLVV